MNRYKLEVDSSSDLSLRTREQTLKWPTLVRNIKSQGRKKSTGGSKSMAMKYFSQDG
jgi:hypothetical protein